MKHLVIASQTPMSLTQPKHLAPAFAEPSCGQRLLQIRLEWVCVACCSITKYINAKYVDSTKYLIKNKQAQTICIYIYKLKVCIETIYIYIGQYTCIHHHMDTNIGSL